ASGIERNHCCSLVPKVRNYGVISDYASIESRLRTASSRLLQYFVCASIHFVFLGGTKSKKSRTSLVSKFCATLAISFGFIRRSSIVEIVPCAIVAGEVFPHRGMKMSPFTGLAHGPLTAPSGHATPTLTVIHGQDRVLSIGNCCRTHSQASP